MFIPFSVKMIVAYVCCCIVTCMLLDSVEGYFIPNYEIDSYSFISVENGANITELVFSAIGLILFALAIWWLAIPTSIKLDCDKYKEMKWLM